MSIATEEFAQRRRALMEQMVPNSIAILPAAPQQTRSRDVEYPYRQDSDFYYLSGFHEPNAVLALIPGREAGEYVVFCQERNREQETWTGYRTGPERMGERFGADDAFPIDDIDEILPGLIEGRDRIYYAMGCDAEFDRQIMEWIKVIRSKERTGAKPPGELQVIGPLLHEMRLIKSEAEIALMRRAAQISAQAHRRAMQRCRPGLREYQLEAELIHTFMLEGCRSPAYPSIVGGGANGCILHYTENQDVLRDGDLVLIDAGGELDHYAADITRTFPVNGRFSPEQRALYELVLQAQLAAIEAVQPGNPFDAPHRAALRILTEGLVRLGLLQGEPEALIEQGGYKRFYMHNTSHWIGMDVHDVGAYKIDGEPRPLQPGMVLTVEPGLYIAPDDDSVEARWRGIGIRIEDDVLVTADGHEILTQGAPKEVAEIEMLMAGKGL